MACLLPVFLMTASYLCGRMLQGMFIRRNKSQGTIKAGETCLIGMFALLLLWEAMVLPAIKLLLPFRMMTQLYSILLLLICANGVITCNREGLRSRAAQDRKWFSLAAVFTGLVFVAQVVSFFFFYPDTTGDTTVETVITTLSSDLIYEEHPFMGTTFKYGITFRGKLVSLPLFYAYLQLLSHSRAVTVVYRLAPFMSLLLNYTVYGIWIDLFTGQAKEAQQLKALCFLMLGLLNLSGSFSHDSVFYYLIHKGFRGETLIFGTVLPYVLYLSFRIFAHHDNQRIPWLLLALAATVTLADVQRGLLPCGLAVLVTFLIVLAGNIRKKVARK